MTLTPDQIAATADGRYRLGKGLSLRVRAGRGVYFYQYRVGDRVRELSIGNRDALTIDQAREAAQLFREMRAMGKDPAAARQGEKKAASALNSRTTFGELATLHITANIAPGFKGAKTERDWRRSLEIHARDLLSKRPADITRDDVADVLRPIWRTKAKTARELRGRIERILAAAKVRDLVTGENVAAWSNNLKEMLPAIDYGATNHPAAPYAEVPAIVAALREDVSEFDLSSLALEFLILTAVRTGDVRGMVAKEVDVEAATWVIPKARMKSRNQKEALDHHVPLSPRALEIVTAHLRGPEDYVFPGIKPGQPLGENAMNHALQRVRDDVVPHGFRTSFRMWQAEQTQYGWELGERALAHHVGTKVSRAYDRSGLCEKRRPMMVDWADFVAGA